MLNKHTRLHEDTEGRVQSDKTHFLIWKGTRTNGKFEMKNVDVELKVNNTSMTQLIGKDEVRILGVHVCP